MCFPTHLVTSTRRHWNKKNKHASSNQTKKPRVVSRLLTTTKWNLNHQYRHNPSPLLLPSFSIQNVRFFERESERVTSSFFKKLRRGSTKKVGFFFSRKRCLQTPDKTDVNLKKNKGGSRDIHNRNRMLFIYTASCGDQNRRTQNSISFVSSIRQKKVRIQGYTYENFIYLFYLFIYVYTITHSPRNFQAELKKKRKKFFLLSLHFFSVTTWIK